MFKIVSKLTKELGWKEIKDECDKFIEKWQCPISFQLPVLPVRPKSSSTKHYYDSETLMKFFNTTNDYRDPMTRESIQLDRIKGYIVLKEFSKQFNEELKILFTGKPQECLDKMRDYLWKDHLNSIHEDERLPIVENHFL